MQVEVDLKCMQTNFGGRGFSNCGDFDPFLVSCPAPSLEEEGSGDTRGFSWAEWNAISADMGWVFITR